MLVLTRQPSLRAFTGDRGSALRWCRSPPPQVASPATLEPMTRNPRPRMNRAQRAFAREHLGLAHQQAQRFAKRHGLNADELLGPAFEGLCKAAIGFDPARGYRPSSYIVPKVKGELLHHLRDTGFALRISHRLRELWMKARRPMAQGYSDHEIAAQLGVSLTEWLDCRQACGLRPLPLEDVEGRA